MRLIRATAAAVIAAVCFFCVFLCAALSCAKAGDYLEENRYEIRRTRVFSGAIDFALKTTAEACDTVYPIMLQQLDELNRQININDEHLDTDVLRLNRAKAHQKIEIGYYAYSLIKISKQIYDDTDGAFNIAVLPLTYLWGLTPQGSRLSFLDSDITPTEIPDQSDVNRVKAMCDLNLLHVFCEGEHEGEKYYAQKDSADIKIDLGGIAKGYAADLCAAILIKHGVTSALVNISGNIYLHGESNASGKNGGNWELAIAHPHGGQKSTEAATAILVEGGKTVLTSGDGERFRMLKTQNGLVRAAHIINPATGYPYGLSQETIDGKSDGGISDDHINGGDRIVSCTLIGDSSTYADAVAKTACINGLEYAKKFFSDRDLSAVILTLDNKMAIIGDVTLSESGKALTHKNKYKII